ncbi:MAG: hypothetical protein ACYTEZ_16205 [Planctomycetota bacterium]
MLVWLANVAVLVVGVTLLQFVYHAILRHESFSLHLGFVVFYTLIGGVLAIWFGWTSTAIVLGILTVWTVLGAWSERKR